LRLLKEGCILKKNQSIKINMKSVLRAAGDAGCYDAKTIIKAFDLAESKGWTKGVISADWMEKIHAWKSFNIKAMQTMIERSQGWAGGYVEVPIEITSLFTGTKTAEKPTRKVKVKVEPTASTGKSMNLRTLLHKCYENHISDSTLALDVLQKMKDSGYNIADKDIDFAQGWRKFQSPAFKKMVENTYNGSNGFAKTELYDCPEFNDFLPIQNQDGHGKVLNVRTVLDKFYNMKCTDAIKILATLEDLEIAGYEGVEAFNVPGLANKTSEEVEKLLNDAHNGEGIFKGMTIIEGCPNF
jgi:hypothetical protein